MVSRLESGEFYISPDGFVVDNLRLLFSHVVGRPNVISHELQQDGILSISFFTLVYHEVIIITT